MRKHKSHENTPTFYCLPSIGTKVLLRRLVPINSADGLVFPHPAMTASLPRSFRLRSGKQIGDMWKEYPASVIKRRRATSNRSGCVRRKRNFG